MNTLDNFESENIPNNIQQIKSRTAKRFIKAHHYLGYAPPGYKYALGVFFDNIMLGVLIFGRPIARLEDQENTLELTRMCLLPSAKNSESRALSLAEKWIKKNTDYKRLIAYADSDRHRGTIYKAANWEMIGISRAGTWCRKTRKRRGIIGGDKYKFERRLR